jgi:hypothetical protein
LHHGPPNQPQRHAGDDADVVPRGDPPVRAALRLGAYQLGWVDGVPRYAAVNESVELVRSARLERAVGFANAILRRLAEEGRPVRALARRPDAVEPLDGVETVRGHPSYRLDWVLKGGIPLARVDDHYQSWMDVRTLASRRFIQDIHQLRRQRLRQFEMYPEERRYEQVDVDEEFELVSDRPLDDISFVFYARTLPLEVGERVTLNRYFREHGNPVTLEVLRREVVEVPLGTFEALVIRPIIKSRGLWDEDAEAEVYISDDADRLVLKVSTRMSLLGSLSLHLTRRTRGVPLAGSC